MAPVGGGARAPCLALLALLASAATAQFSETLPTSTEIRPSATEPSSVFAPLSTSETEAQSPASLTQSEASQVSLSQTTPSTEASSPTQENAETGVVAQASATASFVTVESSEAATSSTERASLDVSAKDDEIEPSSSAESLPESAPGATVSSDAQSSLPSVSSPPQSDVRVSMSSLESSPSSSSPVSSTVVTGGSESSVRVAFSTTMPVVEPSSLSVPMQVSPSETSELDSSSQVVLQPSVSPAESSQLTLTPTPSGAEFTASLTLSSSEVDLASSSAAPTSDALPAESVSAAAPSSGESTAVEPSFSVATQSVFPTQSSTGVSPDLSSFVTPSVSSEATAFETNFTDVSASPTMAVTTEPPVTTEAAESTTPKPGPRNVRVLLVLDGDCQVVVATADSKQNFVAALKAELSELLALSEERVSVDTVHCGSVRAALTFHNVTDPALEQTLQQLVEAGNVSVTVRNGSESVLLTATSVALLRTRPDRHESDWDRQVMWMIIIIVVTITVGMSIVVIITLCVVNHRQKKYQQSFSLGATPASTVRLEDFSLTRMDRPHHLYTADGQLIVKQPNGIQPLNNSSKEVVRSYVHSNGHYALPVDMAEPYDDTSLLRVRRASTERLMQQLPPSELPGIDNPSFAADDILDSGNESDRTSGEGRAEVSNGSLFVTHPPAATSTPGSGRVAGSGVQEDREVSETVVSFEPVSAFASDGFGVGVVASLGMVTGAGALGFVHPGMGVDIPPPPAFAAPPLPAVHDSASDSGAASARHSDIESPSSSELGGAQVKTN